MSHQFKPGDLAVVVRHTLQPAIGRTVELVSRHMVGPINREDPHSPYVEEVESDGSPAWLIVCPAFPARDLMAMEAWLMPLRGDFDFTKERVQELAHG